MPKCLSSLTVLDAPSRINSAAVVVLFYPDEGLQERLERVIHQVSMLIIVANDGINVQRFKNLTCHAIYHILPVHNLGLATALNLGLEVAGKLGYSWCLMLDQDTIINKNLLIKLAEAWEDCPYHNCVAMLAPNYINPNGSRVAYPTKKAWQPIKIAITSGSIIYIPVIDKVGGMREDFFIEGIDVEFSLRLYSLGLQIIASGTPLMTHGAGLAEERQLFGRTVIVTHHSPERYFLQFRNLSWILLHYCCKEPNWSRKAIFSLIKRCFLIAIFEYQRPQKLWAITRGVFCGVFLTSWANSQRKSIN